MKPEVTGERCEMVVRRLTDGIADFVRSCALARFARSGVIDGDNAELELAALDQVGYGEGRAGYRLGVDRRPVAVTFHRQLLHFVACTIPPSNSRTTQILEL